MNEKENNQPKSSCGCDETCGSNSGKDNKKNKKSATNNQWA